MAVTYDAASNSGYQNLTSSLSWSHAWTGINLFLAIDIALLSVNATVTALTYGGIACTLVGAQNVVGGTGRVEQWGITSYAGPAAGSNTVSVTLSGSLACGGMAVSYAGVSQKTPTEAWAGNSGINAGSGTNATAAATTVANNDWVHGALATSQNGGIASAQTGRNSSAGVSGTGANSDTGPLGPGPQTMTWTGEGLTSVWACAAYGILAIGAVATLVRARPMHDSYY